MEGPNTGACLFRDGELVAMAEEERFIRVKRASEVFPSNAIKFCLKQGGIKLKEVQIVATAWDHDKYPEELDKHMRSISSCHLDPYSDLLVNVVHSKLSPELTMFSINIALNKIDPDANPEIVWYPHPPKKD